MEWILIILTFVSAILLYSTLWLRRALVDCRETLARQQDGHTLLAKKIAAYYENKIDDLTRKTECKN